MRCCLWGKRNIKVLFKKVRLVLGSQDKGKMQPGRELMPGQ